MNIQSYIILAIALVAISCLTIIIGRQSVKLRLLKKNYDNMEKRNKGLTRVLDVILDSIPLGVILVNRDNQITNWYYNSGKKIRPSDPSYIGKSIFKVFPLLLPTLDMDLLKDICEATKTTGVSREVPKFSYENRRGLVEHFRIRVFPHYQDMQIEGLILFLQNVTQDALIEEEFLNACAEHEKMKTEFSCAMSNLDLCAMELSRTNQCLSSIYNIIHIVNQCENLERFLQKVEKYAQAYLGWAECTILLAESQGMTVDNARRATSSRDCYSVPIELDNCYFGILQVAFCNETPKAFELVELLASYLALLMMHYFYSKPNQDCHQAI